MKKIYLILLSVLAFSAAQAQCTDLFISEAAEGSGSNKYLEIYNGTGATVDLSNYGLANVGNSPTVVGEYEFWRMFDSGSTIAHGEVLIVCDKDADSVILSHADQFHEFLSNGDDGYGLTKGGTWVDADSNGRIDAGEMTGFTVLDWIGDWNGDPGSGWEVAGVSNGTQNHTLVRKYAFSGDTSWTNAAGTDAASSQWIVNASNDWSNIGTHSASCNPPATPEITFAQGAVWVDEDEGNAILNVVITAASATDTTRVDVVVTGGSAINGTDYVLASPTSLTFLPGDNAPQSIPFSLNDNAFAEEDKTIILGFENLSSNAIYGADSTSTITIVNDDYEVAVVEDIILLDADLKPTNEGFKYEITGIVYGIDYAGNAGLSFTVIDSTSGINVFNRNDISSYTVTEGDEITVRGEIDFYNGLLELKADSIFVVGNGNAIEDPTPVYKPSEETESEFIRLRKVWIADSTTVWPNNDNVLLTNQYQDTFQIRIDRDIVDVVGTPVLYDTMSIIGIGCQFDGSAPYTSGYQIFPRGLADIMEYVFQAGNVSERIIKLSAYPNPTNGQVTIIGKTKWDSYVAYNAQGVVVAEGIVRNNGIDLGELANGYYILNVTSNESQGNVRVLISK